MTAHGDAPAAAPGRLEELLERLDKVRKSEIKGSLMRDDVAMLAGLADASPLAFDLAVDKLEALGFGRRSLQGEIKLYVAGRDKQVKEARRQAAPGGGLQLVRDDMTESGYRPLACLDNMRILLRQHYEGRLSFDLMQNTPCLDGEPMADHHMNTLRADIGRDERVNFGSEDTHAGVGIVAREMKTFHRWGEYLLSTEWDEVPRLNTMARDFLGLPDAYSNRVMRNTMVSGAARGLVHQHAPKLGTVVKTVTILLGYMDAKKSKTWEVIGGEFYGATDVDAAGKQGLMTLHQNGVTELQEIDGMLLGKWTNAQLKRLVSRPHDDFPDPYAHTSTRHMRSFILVGTTNVEQILSDPNGSTRWLVLDLRGNGPEWAVDDMALASVRDQLWAEAVYQFRRYLADAEVGKRPDEIDDRWWFNREENRERMRRAERFTVADPEVEIVGAWLDGEAATCPVCRGAKKRGIMDCDLCHGDGKVTRGPLRRDLAGLAYVTVPQVLSEALGMASKDQRKHAPTFNALAALGWSAGPAIGHRVPWYPPPREAGDDAAWLAHEERLLRRAAEGRGPERAETEIEAARALVAAADARGAPAPLDSEGDEERAAEVERLRSEAEEREP